MLEDVRSVALVGAGTIGGSWAIVFSRAGIETRVYDADERQLRTMRERFQRDLQTLRDAGLGDASQMERIHALLVLEPSLERALRGVAFVQESVPEDLEAKRAVFQRLDELTSPDVVLASSVSALPMSEIAKSLRHPERCVVVHPTNPPHVVPLVEIVPGRETSPAVADAAYSFMERLGQKPIMCRTEIFGFVLNRIQMALLREALYLHREGVASAADIDRCVHEGLGLRWAFLGPFGVEHTNAASIEDDLRKFGPGLRRLFADVGRPYDGPNGSDIARVVEEVDQMFRGYRQPALVEYRNRMILALRALKQAEDPHAD